MIEILLTRLPHGDDLPEPAAQTAGSAGYDLASAEDVVLAPRERRLVGTGWSIAIPEGYECQIRPRSGLALNHGITLPNTPATIDSDYRGELRVALINLSDRSFRVERGMRIAQMVFARVEKVAFRRVDALPVTPRGAAGFGSTGI